MAYVLTHSTPSDSLEAAVRAHFGLSQAELARYLGVSPGLIAHLEAGRRQPTAATSRRLDELARLLPPPEGSGPVAPSFDQPALSPDGAELPLPDFGPLAAGPLRKRYRQAMAQAARLRWALHREGKGLVLHRRRQWGLGVLQAGLAADAAAGPAPDVVAPSHPQHWLATLAADVAATAPGAEAATARALALVRIRSLEAEAAALARLLAAT